MNLLVSPRIPAFSRSLFSPCGKIRSGGRHGFQPPQKATHPFLKINPRGEAALNPALELHRPLSANPDMPTFVTKPLFHGGVGHNKCHFRTAPDDDISPYY
jgi:hypothetical protein